MCKYLFYLAAMAFCQGFCTEISEKGYWVGDTGNWHVTDWKLANAFAIFLHKEKAKTVVDFGCGEGDYTRWLLSRGFECIGYDGNPDTPTITKGLGKVLDLSEPFDLGKTFDWVLSLEVGEHIPHQYETIFIENLMRHADKGIILSWALKSQPGNGHFNCQDNDYIKSIFARYGYMNDVAAENYLREQSDDYFPWFKNSIMVFRR